jgi:diguanylate cyclase (GGDEF)-like protein
MCLILCAICVKEGVTRYKLHDLGYLAIANVSVNTLIYGVFRAGINKKFKDPSLTLFQMTLGMIWIMFCLYGAGEIRSSMLMIFFVVFIFGVFRLRFLQFLFLSVFTLMSYAVVLFLLVRNHPEEVNLKIEVINILFVATILPWFSMVGGYITKLRATISKALETIEKLAVIDELTRVYNRRRLLEILKEQKSVCDRGSRTFSICILDIDHFKVVNDTYGHETGDNVLKKVAETIKANIRDIDSIARYGGEEFMLVLPGTLEAEAVMLAERVRETSEKIRFENMEGFGITVTIGVSEYIQAESFQETINRADKALYRGKEKGRNRVEFERKFESKQMYLF